MALTSPRFRWNSRLQEAEQNNPAMRYGDRGYAVRLIQQAMIDLGIDPMTRSINKFGTTDGIFGRECKGAIEKYQRSKSLGDDGIVGRFTMRALDADLPKGAQDLPGLPISIRYTVPGAITIFDQVAGGHSMGCWAYSYAMMLSWKTKTSVQPADAIQEVGAPYIDKFNNNSGLSHSDTSQFYQRVGMRVKPMQSYPLTEWENMLRTHGPMTIHAVTNSLKGGHVRILYGVAGDDTPRGTQMLIIDPANGRKYSETYEKFRAKYEGGGAQVNRTAQIGHW